MAENFSLAKRCLEAIAENIALRCKDVRLNDGFIYPDVSFSQLSEYFIKEFNLTPHCRGGVGCDLSFNIRGNATLWAIPFNIHTPLWTRISEGV